MKRFTWKRATALVLAVVMALTLVACTGGGNDDGGNNVDTSGSTAGEGKLFTEPTTISITIGSHASWPYDENWVMWKYFEEATGATFDITAFPNVDMDTKVNLMMASPDTLPDLLHVINKKIIDQHATSGAFIAISDNEDKMPNYTKFYDSLDETEREELMAQRTSGDGKIYFPPVYGTQTVNNLRTWMYRKDIFEKNGLSVPTTMNEVYETAKKLKEIYPESYPLAFRNKLEQLDVMGPQFKNDFDHHLYYDFQTNEWRFGAIEPTMKEMAEYFLRMYNEGLVPPDYLTIEAKAWEELVSTDRGFIMPEYIIRIDYFNGPNREVNPDYTWAAMAPPKGDSATGQAKIAKLNYDTTGFVVCNTGDETRINNAIKLLDWMYSDEGSELLSWGKEGETYQVVDGQKEFIINADENPRLKYGVGTYGLYQRVEPASNEAIYTDEQVEQGREAIKYVEDHVNPYLWLPLNDEEQKVDNEYRQAICDFTDSELSKFMTAQRPMSEWDSFVEDVKAMNLDELLAVYDSAYKRVTANMEQQ